MIYPIDEQLERLMDSFVDPETGELKEHWINEETGEVFDLTEDLMTELITTLQMNFEDKIVELRNQFINLVSEAEAIKAEKIKLAKRQKQAEASAERTKRFLAFLLKGEKFQKDAVRISYRRSEEVIPDNGFSEWAAEKRPDLLKFTAPEPKRLEIKQAIRNGEDIPFVHIETKNNIQIK